MDRRGIDVTGGKVKSWLACFGVVPLLLLAMYTLDERLGDKARPAPMGPADMIGYIDGAGDAARQSTVSTQSTIVVWGWAAESLPGASIEGVTVSVDEAPAGAAVLGSRRVDVAEHFGRKEFTDSGWSFSLAAALLRPGRHTVSAVAWGPRGEIQIPGTRSITVR